MRQSDFRLQSQHHAQKAIEYLGAAFKMQSDYKEIKPHYDYIRHVMGLTTAWVTVSIVLVLSVIDAFVSYDTYESMLIIVNSQALKVMIIIAFIIGFGFFSAKMLAGLYGSLIELKIRDKELRGNVLNIDIDKKAKLTKQMKREVFFGFLLLLIALWFMYLLSNSRVVMLEETDEEEVNAMTYALVYLPPIIFLFTTIIGIKLELAIDVLVKHYTVLKLKRQMDELHTSAAAERNQTNQALIELPIEEREHVYKISNIAKFVKLDNEGYFDTAPSISTRNSTNLANILEGKADDINTHPQQ